MEIPQSIKKPATVFAATTAFAMGAEAPAVSAHHPESDGSTTTQEYNAQQDQEYQQKLGEYCLDLADTGSAFTATVKSAKKQNGGRAHIEGQVLDAYDQDCTDMGTERLSTTLQFVELRRGEDRPVSRKFTFEGTQAANFDNGLKLRKFQKNDYKRKIVVREEVQYKVESDALNSVTSDSPAMIQRRAKRR